MESVVYVFKQGITTAIYAMTQFQVLGISLIVWEAMLLVIHVVIRLLFRATGGSA